jgi:hypothetical protein
MGVNVSMPFNLCLPLHQLKLKSVELVKYRTAASDGGGLRPRRTSWRYVAVFRGLSGWEGQGVRRPTLKTIGKVERARHSAARL